MMTRAYNIAYLDDAMAGMGAMLDYAVNTCGEDLSLFYARFLSSGVAGKLSRLNPKYLAGMSGIELARTVALRTGDALPLREPYVDMGSPEYWTGWVLAYLSWYLCLDYGTLQTRGVTVQALRDRYPSLHEADLTKAVRFATRRLQEYAPKPLKQARMNAGLSQKRLANLSGTTLRNIRAYEQGQRSLSAAGAESVMRLCRVLGCRMEDILQS